MAKPKSVIKPTAVYTNSEPVESKESVAEHIKDKNIHVDQNLRDNINYARKDIESHVSNEDVHVTMKEKATWNNKESQQGSQAKANKVMNSLQVHINDSSVHLTKKEKDIFKDKYTKSETRNLLKHSLTGLVFLESVFNRSELSSKYPDPKFNSCVYIRSTKNTVIYNGEKWVDFNGIFTPEVTEKFDGLMTNDDKHKLDTIEEGANNYTHPDDIDTRHVSDAQIDYWNNKAENKEVTMNNPGLMGIEDKIKLDTIEEGANNYTHPETHYPSIIEQDENNRFVTDLEKSSWNNKVDSSYVDERINTTISTTKSMIDTKIANIFNTSKDQLEVLRTLAFELKNDNTVKKFIDLYDSCTKREEFNDHILNNKIHLNKNDIALLENVKSLLESGFPDFAIPDSLPANGGNADTVGNHKVEDLVNNRSFYDYVVGDSSYTKDQVTNIVENTEDISKILDSLCKDKKYSILFKPGYYGINKEIVLRAYNKTISGIGFISNLVGATIRIVGDNNIIENISFISKDGNIVNNPAIIIDGNNNIIRSNIITNYDNGVIVEGSNNIISNNTFINIRREAIKLTAESNSNYGNHVDDNDIRNSGIGIVIISSDKSLTKNHINRNSITNCTSGIVLSNTISDIRKTTMNYICNNTVIRGNGKNSDYLSGHNTIISEFSSNNIISQNITPGKEIMSLNDSLSQNIF